MNWWTFAQIEVGGIFILLLALLVTLCLRKSSAAVRHVVWLVAMLATGLLPVFLAVAPKWSVGTVIPVVSPVIRSYEINKIDAPSFGTSGTYNMIEALQLQLADFHPPVALWLVIGLLIALFFAASYRQATSVVKRSTSSGSEGSATVLMAPISVPATVGFAHPVLLMPASANSWSEIQRRCAIQHELAHVRRKDWLWQLISQALCVLYPLNPMMWFAANRLRAESEAACDDAVLSGGASEADYAQALLDVAKAMGTNKPPLAVVGMTFSSRVDRRIQAILDFNRRRSDASASTILVTASAGIGCCLAIMGAIPSPGPMHLINDWPPASALVGQVVDEQGNALPNADVIVEGFKRDGQRDVYRKKADGEGRFDLRQAMRPGEFLSTIGAHVPGFGIGAASTSDDRRPLRIVCGKAHQVRIQVLTDIGSPAKGVKVYVDQVVWPQEEIADSTEESILKMRYFVSGALRPWLSGITDADGIASIDGLMAGCKVRVQVDDKRFAKLFNIGLDYPPVQPIEDSPVTDIGVVKLQKPASISGRLVWDGKPLGGVRMTTDLGFEVGESAITDSQGHYTIRRLPARDRFSGGTDHIRYYVEADSDTRPDGLVIYPTGMIQLRPGESLKGVNPVVSRTATIRGTVNADRATLDHGLVVHVHNGRVYHIPDATVGKDGSFTAQVPPGYTTLEIADYSGTADKKLSEQTVNVPEGGTANVRME
jgi:beta-lactamase regulating signal transducer with metallopeptidase domain